MGVRHRGQTVQEGFMTRQCAWCSCYLDSVESETVITHGICEQCAEQIRRSWPEPLLEEVLVATQAHAKIVGTELKHAA
jgi:hypothetical protein